MQCSPWGIQPVICDDGEWSAAFQNGIKFILKRNRLVDIESTLMFTKGREGGQIRSMGVDTATILKRDKQQGFSI